MRKPDSGVKKFLERLCFSLVQLRKPQRNRGHRELLDVVLADRGLRLPLAALFVKFAKAFVTIGG